MIIVQCIFSVYSWFFLINLMKTGIGQSKYCTPQPFSRCLISLCSSLFDLNSIFYQLLIMKIYLFRCFVVLTTTTYQFLLMVNLIF